MFQATKVMVLLNEIMNLKERVNSFTNMNQGKTGEKDIDKGFPEYLAYKRCSFVYLLN